MIKVLIADDEKIIREGLVESIDWDGLGLTLVGTARNGEDALKIAEVELPDICLVDIMMPVVNGLEFIERITKIKRDIVCIIITGYDEFSYAQRAIKLNTFDYLLKPVDENELTSILRNAIEKIASNRGTETKLSMVETQIRETFPNARKEHIRKCLYGRCEIGDTTRFENVYGVSFEKQIGVAVVALSDCMFVGNEACRPTETDLLTHICRFSEEIFTEYCNVLFCAIENIGVVTVAEAPNDILFDQAAKVLEKKILEDLSYRACVYRAISNEGIDTIEKSLIRIETDLKQNKNYTPIVRKIKEYIDENYRDSTLSLKKIVSEFNISAGHISRLFKQEIGISYCEYIEQKRIGLAVTLLIENNCKVYEIAEKVGYSSQHYFCTAFKRALGCAPSDYKRRFSNEKVV